MSVFPSRPTAQRTSSRTTRTPPTPTPARRRDERGLVFPSPVVLLSVIAVAMAAVAFLATRGTEPTEREVAITASDTPAAAATPAPATTTAPAPAKERKPAVDRSKIYVEVYNNSGVKGLAGTAAERADAVGWSVVGADNWYGTVPATTVYYPKRLERAAKRLALDLGVKRTAPAIDPMRQDRLTLILTGPLG